MAKANMTFYHPAKNNEGMALSVEMHYQMENRPGFIRFRMARQDGDRFDFDDAVAFDAKVVDAAKMLLVLRNEETELNGGIPMEFGDVRFVMKRIEKDNTYAMACMTDGSDDKRLIILSRAEALGLCSSIEGAMFFLSFVKGVNP